MDRFICVHGHFYQPPRENPWLEAIELQDAAYPYHDWNARITAECYATNATARILNSAGEIVRIVNNYSRISYNVGPTLLAWMEPNAPEVYRAVIRADLESQEHCGGHGSAMAQAYNHVILPLADARDKETQVAWGIRDFRRRFDREPEGMWLPETAVDIESLEVMARHGIRFTVLAPHQAARVRPLDGAAWRETKEDSIDVTRPYLQKLPSGRSIAIFFYNGVLSRAVAFEGLLRDGKAFADRLLSGFNDSIRGPQLVTIATDGETYGHHHRHGEMALAYALHNIENGGRARLTNYAEFLERFPPTMEVEIAENTSWSCAHGIERWRGDCGCHTGGKEGWNQRWRGPLRAALDWLRDELASRFERAAGELVRDPWAARDDYIDVIADRSPESVDEFVARNVIEPIDREGKVRLLKLLELQRHALLMYTSCGWFFNELSGIETVQVAMYASRAVQLAAELFGVELEPQFLALLELAESNVAEEGNGRQIYERHVRPSVVDLLKVGAHYAAASLFEPYNDRTRIYCYTVIQRSREVREAGEARLVIGRARIASDITLESEELSYVVLHMGDHNLNAGIRRFQDVATFEAVAAGFRQAFSRADLATVIRYLDRSFEGTTFSLKSLFRDEQRRVLDRILDSSIQEAGETYRHVFEHHAPLMRFLLDLGMPLPPPFRMAADFTLNRDLRRLFSRDEAADLPAARSLLEEAQEFGVALDNRGLGYAIKETLEELAGNLRHEPESLETLIHLVAVAGLARTLPFEVDLWQVQNIFYGLKENVYPGVKARALDGYPAAQEWADAFSALARSLRVAMEDA